MSRWGYYYLLRFSYFYLLHLLRYFSLSSFLINCEGFHLIPVDCCLFDCFAYYSKWNFSLQELWILLVHFQHTSRRNLKERRQSKKSTHQNWNETIKIARNYDALVICDNYAMLPFQFVVIDLSTNHLLLLPKNQSLDQ